MSDLLRLEGLRKSFGKRVLLDIGVLEVPENTCVVLSGRNGAGKSMLLKRMFPAIIRENARN